MPQLIRVVAALIFTACHALAKTDLVDCEYIEGTYTPSTGEPWGTRTYYLPDTGEVCEYLNCGGVAGPPKTTVPGCPHYAGTRTYQPQFLVLETLTGTDGQPTTVVASVTGGTSETISSLSSDVVTSIFAAMTTSTDDGEDNTADRTRTVTELVEPSFTTGAAASPTVGLGPRIAAGVALMGIL